MHAPTCRYGDALPHVQLRLLSRHHRAHHTRQHRERLGLQVYGVGPWGRPGQLIRRYVHVGVGRGPTRALGHERVLLMRSDTQRRCESPARHAHGEAATRAIAGKSPSLWPRREFRPSSTPLQCPRSAPEPCSCRVCVHIARVRAGERPRQTLSASTESTGALWLRHWGKPGRTLCQYGPASPRRSQAWFVGCEQYASRCVDCIRARARARGSQAQGRTAPFACHLKSYNRNMYNIENTRGGEVPENRKFTGSNTGLTVTGRFYYYYYSCAVSVRAPKSSDINNGMKTRVADMYWKIQGYLCCAVSVSFGHGRLSLMLVSKSAFCTPAINLL